MSNGHENLASQVLESISDELERVHEFHEDYLVACESQIEELLFNALVCAVRFGPSFLQIIPTNSRDTLHALLAREGPYALVIEPQSNLENTENRWRVDFLIHAWEFGRLSGKAQWRRLIVECDGHEFHERTKEQAARDRSRDREFQMRGYTVLRFTGSEIHNRPLDCAKQIIEWVKMGW